MVYNYDTQSYKNNTFLISEEDLSTKPFNCTPYPHLEIFYQFYKPIHAYLSLSVCLFGTLTNILNAVILTHSKMRSPTNMLLTCIALADSVTMVSYIMKDIYLHFITSSEPHGAIHGYAEIQFLLITNSIAICGHIAATVITVMLSIFRYLILHNSRYTITYKQITITVLSSAVIGASFSLPGLLIFKIIPLQLKDNTTVNTVDENNSSINTEKINWWFELRNGTENIDRASFAIYGCIIKLLASILIGVFTGLILTTMKKARKRYMLLKRQVATNTDMTGNANKHKESACLRKEDDKIMNSLTTMASNKADNLTEHNQSRSSQRTTIMLIAVVVSFVITEAPQGIINTLVTFKGNCFLFGVYVPIGDFLDLLILLNASTNFILYCAMSQKFRESFRNIATEELLCTWGKQRSLRTRQMLPNYQRKITNV